MTVAALPIATEVAVIAELAILPRERRDISAALACSDIGFSCQLKATLCLMAATSQNKLPERKVTCE